MQLVDTIVSREGGNSAWANVIFLGDGGETVSVRLPCPVPSGGIVGRTRIIERAAALLRRVSDSASTRGETPQAAYTGRFGVPAGRIVRSRALPDAPGED